MANLKFGKMVMRSLFKKPATRMYPVTPREYTEITRGHIEVDMDACILCGICDRKCPTDAIKVSKDDKTWSIQRMRCIQCNCCIEVCPVKCLTNLTDYTQPSIVKIADIHEKPSEGETKASKCTLNVDDTCTYCGICEKKCPLGIIKTDRQAKTWEVDNEKCTCCGLCVENCPKKSLTISE